MGKCQKNGFWAFVDEKGTEYSLQQTQFRAVYCNHQDNLVINPDGIGVDVFLMKNIYTKGDSVCARCGNCRKRKLKRCDIPMDEMHIRTPNFGTGHFTSYGGVAYEITENFARELSWEEAA